MSTANINKREFCAQLTAQELVSLITDAALNPAHKDQVDKFLLNLDVTCLDILCPSPAIGYRASPLMTAAILNQLETVRALLQIGSSPNFTDMYGRSALIRVIQTPLPTNELVKRTEIVEMLIDSMGAAVNSKDCVGRDALLYSIETGDLSSFEALVRNGADVNTTDRDEGFSALTYAVALDKRGVRYCIMLLENKAEPNSCDRAGKTPLMYAKCPDKARILIEHGANVNHQDNQGRTPLMSTCCNDRVSEVLIKSGADIFLRDRQGKTVMEHLGDRDDSLCAQMCTKIILENLARFFAETRPEDIRNQIKRLVKTKNEEFFPIHDYHWLAIKWLPKVRAGYSSEQEFLDEFKSLKYFLSLDFGEKMWADVIQALDEENIEVDGQLLRIMRLRSKTKQEADELANLVGFINAKQKSARNFYNLVNSFLENFDKK